MSLYFSAVTLGNWVCKMSRNVQWSNYASSTTFAKFIFWSVIIFGPLLFYVTVETKPLFVFVGFQPPIDQRGIGAQRKHELLSANVFDLARCGPSDSNICYLYLQKGKTASMVSVSIVGVLASDIEFRTLCSWWQSLTQSECMSLQTDATVLRWNAQTTTLFHF